LAKLINYFFDKDIYKSPLYLSLVCFVFGIFFSRAILSISIVLFLAASIYFYYTVNKKKLNKAALVFLTFYLVLILSYWNTTNYTYWLDLIYKNAVFIILPLAFIFLNKTPRKTFIYTFNLFLGLTLISAVINAVHALSNYNLNSDLAIKSKTLDPIIGANFHDLSLIYAIVIIYLAYKIIKDPNLNYSSLLTFLVLAICVVILSYRFALIILVFSALLIIIKFANYKKKLFLKVFLSLSVLSLGFLYSPLVNKIKTTLYDLESIYGEVNPNFKSLGQRWAAVKCTVEIVNNNLIFGVGAPDLPLEMQKQYEQNSYLLIPENRIFIHNQFLFYTASYGIFGLSLFIAFLGYLINKFNKNKQQLALVILTVFIAQMLIENSLEFQIPSYLFLMFMLYFHSAGEQLEENTKTETTAY
jgi:O-antigen ligase